MRMMMRVRVPVEAGNAAVQSGELKRVIEAFLTAHKPEAAYFSADGGERTAYFFVDMADVTMMPALAEPFFAALSAKVEFMPVMSAADLQKGLSSAAAS